MQYSFSNSSIELQIKGTPRATPGALKAEPKREKNIIPLPVVGL